MNTDNVAISGETIDYGPCAFMNAYDPNTVYSSIDHGGRYSYGNQPQIMQWNLARLAETLLPLFDSDLEQSVAFAKDVVTEFPARFERYWLAGMRGKLGLTTEQPDDLDLVRSLHAWMHETGADFTRTFRSLSREQPDGISPKCDAGFTEWTARWHARIQREEESLDAARARMRKVNPAVIPRNHRVEEALAAAEEHDDLSPLHRLVDVLSSPFDERPEFADYEEPPADESGYRTFCGT
jgi:uncharacterized protein YdiU (UPF0061 family)